MMNKRFKMKDVSLARIKYFDEEHNGVEVSNIDAYALLHRVGDKYINIFNPERELPVYGRVPYSNSTMDGESYGSKIVQLTGECVSGPCYVMDYDRCDGFFEREYMNYDELRQYVIKSSRFFVDRYDMIMDGSIKEKVVNNKTLRRDRKRIEEFNEYMDSHKNKSFHK